jgi:hypothetical protein
MIINWGVKWSACLPPSSAGSPPALDIPWPSCPSADVTPATSSDLKLSQFTSTFRDPVIDIPRPLPAFLIRSSTFLDFAPSSFCFPDLSIRSISAIHFSTILDPLRTPPMHSSLFAVIARPHSAFVNKFVFNGISVSHDAADFLNVLFLARGRWNSVVANFLKMLFFFSGFLDFYYLLDFFFFQFAFSFAFSFLYSFVFFSISMVFSFLWFWFSFSVFFIFFAFFLSVCNFIFSFYF